MSPMDMIYLPLRHEPSIELRTPAVKPLIGIFPYYFSMERPLFPTLISMQVRPFDEAVKRRPGRIVTLRRRTRLLADSHKV